MPYKGDSVLDFPQDENRNTLLVLGDNMRGKTSLLNGIRWAFYGKAQGRHLRPIQLHQMVNTEAAAAGDWTMTSRIEFEAGGSRYDLRREATRKATVARPERPEDFQVFAYLQKDGQSLPASEIEAEINKFAPEQVSRFFLFDGELLQEYEELLVEESEQGKRIKAAIEQALGVPALTRGRSDLHSLWKKSQKAQADEAATRAGLEEIGRSQQKWLEKLSSAETDLTELRRQQAALKAIRQSLEDEVQAAEVTLRHKAELTEHQRRRVEIQRSIDDKTTLKLTLIKDAWRDLIRARLVRRREELQERLSTALDAGRAWQKLQFELEHAKEHLGASVCPECGQSLPDDGRSAREIRVNEIETRLRDFAAHDDAQEIAKEIKRLEPILNVSVRARLGDNENDLRRLNADLTVTETKIDELEEALTGQATEELLRKKQQHGQATRDEIKVSLDIAAREADVAKANQEVQILGQRIDAQGGRDLSRATRIARLYENLFNSFEMSIANLRSDLRETVEENATKAFRAMSTQKGYKRLSINENYGLTIIGDDDQPVPIRSAGAEQIVALSLIDGLSHSGRSAGPVVMDTPFGRLDTKHRHNILAYLPDSARQLVLFVHDGEMGPDSMEALAHRIGGRYEITEVSPSHSILEKRS